MATFGNRMRDIRKDLNLTLEELAEKLNTTKATLSRYENDKRFPDIYIVKEIANVLNVDINYLLGNSDIKKPYNTEDDLPDDFETAEEAIDFLLNKNVIMGFGGFDVEKLSDEEKVQFAHELLEHLKLLSYKYKR